MNTNTGKIYTDVLEIERAKKRGEPLMELSPTQAKKLRRMSREERKRWAKRRKTDNGCN